MEMLLFLAVLLGMVSAAMSCSCCTAVICQPQCPPPVICPPPQCPPPMPCPPPPPPPPMPMCPPPDPCQPPPMIMQHQCCVMCIDPCMFGRRKRDTNAELGISMLDVNDDPVCNNKKLKTIIEENIAEDAVSSKKKVQKAIEEAKLDVKYNVICAKDEFAYATYTDDFCQAGRGPISCYVFKPVLA